MSNRMIVIGTGPIGGIIGGRLARGGHDITFVDVDREHVQAIREKGLQVEVPDGSFNVKVKILFPDEIEGKYDIGLIAVIDLLVSLRAKLAENQLAVEHVHLAAEGFKVDLAGHIEP